MAAKSNKRADKSTAFHPDSDQISDAVQNFLKSGGRITRYVDYDEEFEHFAHGGSYRHQEHGHAKPS
ncbi:MAG: hypothetical protein A2527_13920 [Candidatus Lambdaproteobacteria bacterium RIFOXYD2_FULL_50_16]|uniref:Uncharacterized protein n=1 Tax=Candidatus Lambdaproteobacteria bacterium RIFOXYD2_FULL_50_16 TaxID=1817772 RepID=A0A1F6G4J1_9PROT|nr:MAG: hypothetical protein A2527_13920 [Candidatus Lambdaproteobacteria bacterium RIFOXYD2_FULL_50_16]